MKKINFLFVALCLMATTAYAQLSSGSQYRIFCEAAPTHGLYGADPFFWDGAQPDAFFVANNIADRGADVWQFEFATGKYFRTAGGGTTQCGTSTNPTELSSMWKLIADGSPVSGVQYYLLQSQHNTARYLYFNPTGYKLFTQDTNLPTDDTRKNFRIGFEHNVAPVLNVSASTLAFSSGFLSKNITKNGENMTGDITFGVPAGITLSGTNVVNDAENYSIAAANANGSNTVTITAGSDEGINGILTISATGANTKNMTLKSGLKQDAWYNIKLFHASLQLYIDADITTPTLPAVQELDTNDPTQYFTFIPVAGKDETFQLKNAADNYLVGNSDGSVEYVAALTGTTADEWSLGIRNGNTVIDYFDAFTLKVGSRPIPATAYLALSAGSAAGVSVVCNK
jgi:hypothetical protein